MPYIEDSRKKKAAPPKNKYMLVIEDGPRQYFKAYYKTMDSARDAVERKGFVKGKTMHYYIYEYFTEERIRRNLAYRSYKAGWVSIVAGEC